MKKLEEYVRSIPDFPEPGIIFRDVTSVLQDADGLLEKRYVVTGKSLWGSYTEILSGLTPEDLIAFPYGKHVKVGAPAVESDLSTLYGY